MYLHYHSSGATAATTVVVAIESRVGRMSLFAHPLRLTTVTHNITELLHSPSVLFAPLPLPPARNQ